ncbi:hypothetical protein PENTCL1PPCAC_15529, partial [Pristionchus entomophagus]
MQTRDDAIHIIIYAILDCSALCANAVLIAAIVKKTPRVMKSYSVLLLNTSLVDCCTAISSLLSTCRLQMVNGNLYFISVGPCVYFGAQFCHRLVFFSVLQACLVVHSSVLLFTSFCFRMWMLGRTSLTNFVQPRIRNMCLITLGAAIPSVL